jgi:hypothetical protein
VFHKNGNSRSSTDIAVISSNSKITRLALAVPSVNEGSSMALVRICSKTFQNACATFNYLYTVASPSIAAVNPSTILDKGGQTIFVTIRYFRYSSSRFIVNFANNFLPAVVLPQSDFEFTFLSFTTPLSAIQIGEKSVSIHPSDAHCEISCPEMVSLTLLVEDTETLKLKSEPFQSVSAQRLRHFKKFPGVSVTGLSLTIQCSDIFGTVLLEDGRIETIHCDSLNTYDNRTYWLVMAFTGEPFRENSMQLELVILAKHQNLTYNISVFDAQNPYIISINPSQIPVTTQIGKDILVFEQSVRVLVRNFPVSIGNFFLSATLSSLEGIFPIEIIEKSHLPVACSELEIELLDCKSTSILLRFPPQSLAGPKTLVIRNDRGLYLESSVKFPAICDYEKFCGMSIPDHRQIMASMQIDCNPDFCLDPGSIPDPILISRFPSRGIVNSRTVVEIDAINFPAFHISDVVITLGTKIAPLISFESSGNLRRNRVKVKFLIPSTSYKILGDHLFVVSAITRAIKRQVNVPFRFLPRVQGPPIVLDFSPKSALVDSNLSLLIRLQNIQELEQINGTYDTSVIQIRAIDPNGIIRSGLSIAPKYSHFTCSVLVISNVTIDIKGHWNINIVSISFETIAEEVNITLSVNETTPIISNVYPDLIPSHVSSSIQVQILYLPPRQGDVLVSAILNSDLSNSTALNGIQMNDMSSRSCYSPQCSVSYLRVLMPAQNSFVLTKDSTAFVSLHIMWNDKSSRLIRDVHLSFSFRYISLQARQTQWFPSSIMAGSNVSVSSRIDNLKCHDMIINFVHPMNMSDPKWACSSLGPSIVYVVLYLPPCAYANKFPIKISSFDRVIELISYFEYLSPQLQIEPVDGSAEGGFSVEVIVRGWASANVSSMKVTFEDEYHDFVADAAIETLFGEIFTDSKSQFSLILLVPSFPLFGSSSEQVATVTIQSMDGRYSSVGSFSYFAPPKISSIRPGRASIFGMTDSPDRRSIVAEIRGMPNSIVLSDIQVSFSGIFGKFLCDGESCEISNLVNAADMLILTVKILRFRVSPGPGKLTIQYIAQTPYQNRTASTDFEFFTPAPSVLSVKWCQHCQPCTTWGCPACLQYGLCVSGEGSTLPMAYAAASNSSFCTDTCHGVFQIVVANVPAFEFDPYTGIIAPSARIICSFGEVSSFGVLRRIVSQTENSLIFEIEPPPMAATDQVLAKLSFYPSGSLIPSTVHFTVNFFDEGVQLLCDKNVCQSFVLPAGGRAFTLNITNFDLDEGVSIQNQLNLLFGNQPAIAIQMISWKPLALKVKPPLPPNADGISSHFQVPLKLITPQNSRIISSTTFTYWVAPKVMSAEYGQSGEKVSVLFSAGTNAGGFSLGAGNCSAILKDTSLLGVIPTCVWIANDHLTIFLGNGAILLPGNSLEVINIQSQNQVTDPTSITFQVQPPGLRIAPRIWLQGPSTIDQCSALTIKAFSSSARPLTYSWSCSNDDFLNSIISHLTLDSLQLREGTPEMTILDKSYVISVKGRDFLGTSSQTRIIYVTKRLLPTPQSMYTPERLNILKNQAAIVKFHTAFSKCSASTADIEFSWRQVSGPLSVPVELLRPIPELNFPANTLTHGSIYTFALTVAMSNDISQSSETFYTINVGEQQLEARIKGGNRDISFYRDLVLDGSLSRDPDATTSSKIQGVAYKWKCSTYDHDGLEYPCISLEGVVLQLETTSTIRVPAGKLRALGNICPYWFTLVVSKAGKLPVTATVFVNMHSAILPAVDVSIPSMFHDNIQSDGSISLGPNARLALQGHCSTLEDSVQYSWTFDSNQQSYSQFLSPEFIPLGYHGPNFVLDFGVARVSVKSNFIVSLACVDSRGTSTASIQVVLNYPPSGGSCKACLDDTSGLTCIKKGYPLFDAFTLSCSGWSSENLPLQYSFGFQDSVSFATTTWLRYSFESSLHFIFPTGTFLCKAIIKDSLEIMTGEIEDTDHIRTVERQRRAFAAEDRRKLVENALKALKDILHTKDSSKIETQVAVITREVNGIAEHELHNDSLKWRWDLLSALFQESQFSIVNQDFVCGTFDKAALITSSATLTDDSLILSALFARKLIDASGVISIGISCMSSAMKFYASAIKGLSRLNDKNNTVVQIVLDNLQPFVLTCVNKFGVGMLSGESRVIDSKFSIFEMRRLSVEDLALQNLCRLSHRSMLCDHFNLELSLPEPFFLMTGLKINDIVNVVLHGYMDVPIISEGGHLISSSPIVGLSIQFSNGTSLEIKNISEPINFTFLVPVPEKSICVYWNQETSMHSSNNLHTIRTQNSDICQARHLGLFGLAESGNGLSMPTTASSKTNVLVIPDLEGLGLRVLVPTKCFLLSENSNRTLTIASPMGPVQIEVPAGFMRKGKHLQISFCVTIVQLSENITLPPQSVGMCSVAVDLQPHQLELNTSILVSLPCNGAPLGAEKMGFMFDLIGRTWLQEQNQIIQNPNSAVTWLSISELSLHAVFFVSTSKLRPAVKETTVSMSTIAAIAGLGGVVFMVLIVVFFVVRRQRKCLRENLSDVKVVSGNTLTGSESLNPFSSYIYGDLVFQSVSTTAVKLEIQSNLKEKESNSTFGHIEQLDI